jgi:hypothetical protein
MSLISAHWATFQRACPGLLRSRLTITLTRGGWALWTAFKSTLFTPLWWGYWLLIKQPLLIGKGWAKDAWTSFKRKGYLLIPTLIAAYVGIYSIMEARQERVANRALFERSTFMTMVVSGNRGTFIAAMKTFGPVQTMTVPRNPELLAPWTWSEQEMPNKDPLHAWVHFFFPLCTAETCGNPVHGSPIDLTSADLRGAHLRGADLTEAKLDKARLNRADLRSTVHLTQAQLNTACIDDFTQLPSSLVRPEPWCD